MATWLAVGFTPVGKVAKIGKGMKAVSGASKFTMGTKSGTKAGKSLKQKVKKASPKKATKKSEKSSKKSKSKNKKPKKPKGKKDTNKPKTKAKKKTSPVKAGGKAGKKAKPLKLNLQFFGNKQNKAANPAKVGKNTGKQAKGMGKLLDDDLAKMYKDVQQGIASTGRTIPNTLEEQLAMKQVLSNPLKGAKDLSDYVDAR